MDYYYGLPEWEYDPNLTHDPGKFALVSSLYGPGTTGCWHLTVLSCLVSWLAHPTKRRDDSISADFIAMITLPVASCIHLMLQARQYLDQRNLVHVHDDQIEFRRFSRSVEASLNITENSLLVVCIFGLVAAYFRNMKRVGFLVVIGVLLASAESYLCSKLSEAGLIPNYHFYRRFLADYLPILIAVVVVVSLLLIQGIALLLMFLFDRLRFWAKSSDRDQTPGSAQITFATSSQATWITIFSLIYLGIATLMALFPITSNSMAFARQVSLAASRSSGASGWVMVKRFFSSLFPRSGLSITELDQTINLLAGLTVLAYSIYSAASAHYKAWIDRRGSLQRQRRAETIWLERLSLQSRAVDE